MSPFKKHQRKQTQCAVTNTSSTSLTSLGWGNDRVNSQFPEGLVARGSSFRTSSCVSSSTLTWRGMPISGNFISLVQSAHTLSSLSVKPLVCPLGRLLHTKSQR